MANKKTLTKEEALAKRADREMAKKIKAEVFQLEKKNDSHLYVFRSTEGWWKIGGRSALFFKYRVCPKIGLKYELRNDRDFYYSFREGIISIKSPESLEEKLKSLKIYKKGVEKGYIVFDLPFGPISDEQVKEMRNLEKDTLREINTIVNPAEVLIKTLPQARLVQKSLFELCRKLDEPTRELIGRDIVHLSNNMMDRILCVCKGSIPKRSLPATVKGANVQISTRIMLLMDEKRVDVKNGAKILKHLEFLERLCLEECANEKKEEQNE